MIELAAGYREVWGNSQGSWFVRPARNRIVSAWPNACSAAQQLSLYIDWLPNRENLNRVLLSYGLTHDGNTKCAKFGKRIMIKFSLRCGDGHNFDSWFQSSEAYESLDSSKMLSCPICGSEEIQKDIMSPQVRSARAEAEAPKEEKPKANLSKPASPVEKALAELRQVIEKNSEYVGKRFTAEARSIHDGTSPERSIYGEADSEDARALFEEGIPVAPLPWWNDRRTH